MSGSGDRTAAIRVCPRRSNPMRINVARVVPLFLCALFAACNEEKAQCFDQNIVSACNSLCDGAENEEACAKAKLLRHEGCFEKHDAEVCQSACMWDQSDLACKEASKIRTEACMEKGDAKACEAECLENAQSPACAKKDELGKS